MKSTLHWRENLDNEHDYINTSLEIRNCVIIRMSYIILTYIDEPKNVLHNFLSLHFINSV